MIASRERISRAHQTSKIAFQPKWNSSTSNIRKPTSLHRSRPNDAKRCARSCDQITHTRTCGSDSSQHPNVEWLPPPRKISTHDRNRYPCSFITSMPQMFYNFVVFFALSVAACCSAGFISLVDDMKALSRRCEDLTTRNKHQDRIGLLMEGTVALQSAEAALSELSSYVEELQRILPGRYASEMMRIRPDLHLRDVETEVECILLDSQRCARAISVALTLASGDHRSA